MSYQQLLEPVQVEISGYLLAQLISTGVIHADECKYLNDKTKKVIWYSLLASIVDDQKNLATQPRSKRLAT